MNRTRDANRLLAYSGVHTYCVVFLLCLSPSCVPYVASFSGLSICDYSCGILLRLFPSICCILIDFKKKRQNNKTLAQNIAIQMYMIVMV